MESQEAETVWAREEACAAHLRDGDHEKAISFVHDQFQGLPSSASPLLDREGLLDFFKKDIAEGGKE